MPSLPAIEKDVQKRAENVRLKGAFDDPHAEAGDQHQQEQDEGDDEQERGDPADLVEADAREERRAAPGC